MPDTVNVVVTCTKTKRVPVDADCRLRAIGRGTIAGRLRRWRQRLAGRRRTRVPVAQLYAGDHWSVVRSLGSNRFNVDVWVCSAGHGLVNVADRVAPYSATFSPTHPDSVCRNLTDCAASDAPRTWWQLLKDGKAASNAGPGSLRQLAELHPNRALLVVASETYLKAIADDLREALAATADPSLLSIISCGSRGLPGLTDHLVPCDARLQAAVKGARRSLNVRIAAKVLAECRTVPRLPALKRKLRKLLDQQPDLPRYDRTPLSDAEVCNFISRSLRKNESLRRTPLLQSLRARGAACEQSRFASLYRQVQDQLHGRSKKS